MGVLKLFDRRFGTTGKTEPTSPRETFSNHLDHIPDQASHGGGEGAALNEGVETRDGRGGKKIGNPDTKDGNWIAYAPGAQEQVKSGRPKN